MLHIRFSLVMFSAMSRPIGSKSGASRQRVRIQKEIAKRIRETRIKRGLSQTTLAERIHSTQQCVSLWEANKTMPDIDALLSLSIVLGVTAGWLTYGEGTP